MAADFMTHVATLLKRPVDRSQLITELGVDSFDLVDLLVRLQEDLEVRIFQEDVVNVKTLGDLEAVFQSRRAR